MALIGVLHTAYCGSGQILSIHAVTYMPEELSIRIEYTHTQGAWVYYIRCSQYDSTRIRKLN